MTGLYKLFTPKVMTNKYTIYREYRPTQALRPYIHCYWSSVPGVHFAPASFTDTVIPDGCSDIIVEFDTATKTYNMIYCGIFDHYFQTEEVNNLNKAFFGIRFFPGGALPFLDYKQKEFSNMIVDISEINKSLTGQIGEHIVHASSNTDRVKWAEAFLLKKLSNKIGKTTSSSLLNNMLYTIFSRNGNISVHELCSMEFTDARTVNRLFHKWIGLSPKKFCQIIRFQSTVQALVDKTNPLTVASQFGYYDQAHFIHDFNKYLGKTPSAVNLSDFYNTISEA
ncbi:DUF6597 domain-containing transcriptional factor [Virgibacillus oceani]